MSNTKVTSEMCFISPDYAAALLRSNAGNRPISRPHVADLAAQMSANTFVFNGDSIRIDSSGALLDGQHRLSAIVASGVGQTMMIVRGLSRDSFATIDQNRRRSGADVVSVLGATQATAVAAATQAIVAIEQGRVGFGGFTRLAPNALAVAYRARPGIDESVHLVRANASGMRGHPYLAAIHWICSPTDSVAATRFVVDVGTGEMLTNKRAAYHLRDRLMRKQHGRMAEGHMFALVIKAWNAELHGVPISRLSLRPEGENAETFPTIARSRRTT